MQAMEVSMLFSESMTMTSTPFFSAAKVKALVECMFQSSSM